LQHLGLIAPGVHKIDTPVGQVSATLHEDGAVTVGNVPAYRYRQQVAVDVPGFGACAATSPGAATGSSWFPNTASASSWTTSRP
jgi:4-hydroxyproline epimerase